MWTRGRRVAEVAKLKFIFVLKSTHSVLYPSISYTRKYDIGLCRHVDYREGNIVFFLLLFPHATLAHLNTPHISASSTVGRLKCRQSFFHHMSKSKPRVSERRIAFFTNFHCWWIIDFVCFRREIIARVLRKSRKLEQKFSGKRYFPKKCSCRVIQYSSRSKSHHRVITRVRVWIFSGSNENKSHLRKNSSSEWRENIFTRSGGGL